MKGKRIKKIVNLKGAMEGKDEALGVSSFGKVWTKPAASAAPEDVALGPQRFSHCQYMTLKLMSTCRSRDS